MTSSPFLIFALAGSAIAGNIISSVNGSVKTQNSLAGNLVVTLTATERGEQVAHTGVNADGSFEFHNVVAGAYLVQLETPSGEVLERVISNIGGPEDRIEIRVGDPNKEPPGPAATVSVSELRHPISAKAASLFARAHKESAKGNYGNAIALLRQSFSDPAAVPYAHLNIGVAMAKSGDVPSAIGEFRLAATLAPDNALAHRDLAYVLLQTKDYRTAESECRRSLETDKTSSRTYWILGVALLNEGVDDVEAIQSLRYASREIPAARLVLAQYFEQKGEKDQAVEELRAALPDVDAREKDRVTHWISSLSKE